MAMAAENADSKLTVLKAAEPPKGGGGRPLGGLSIERVWLDGWACAGAGQLAQRV